MTDERMTAKPSDGFSKRLVENYVLANTTDRKSVDCSGLSLPKFLHAKWLSSPAA
jgi:hypothetical protein